MRKIKGRSILAIIAVVTLLMGNAAYAGEADALVENAGEEETAGDLEPSESGAVKESGQLETEGAEEAEEVEEAEGVEDVEEYLVNAAAPGLSYYTHVQNEGDQAAVTNGAVSGTSGKSYRLEGIWISLTGDYSGGITYRTHVQNYGWQNWVSGGQMSGTTGESKRLEAIQIKLTGALVNEYDVYYRVHCQNYGWLNWAKNGEYAGSEGLSKRLEAIQIILVKKGTGAPGKLNGIESAYSDPYVTGALYRTHVQNIGWQSYVGNGQMSGTSGKSYRLEGINIKLTSDIDGGITYQTHIQSIGWQGWKSNGDLSGTSGRSLRLEAIQIKLTGAAANNYDVYYRVHCQNFGWMGWTKNGASAGTSGFSKRLEGIEIKVVPKGSDAPGSTNNAFVKDETYTVTLADGTKKTFVGHHDIAYAQEVVKLVNAYRAEKGLYAYSSSSTLETAAAIRSYEIVALFEHQRPDGSSISGMAPGLSGENIAMGYATPAEVMKGWKNSSGHNQNILSTYHTKVAVGVFAERYETGSGNYKYRYYWVQIFGV